MFVEWSLVFIYMTICTNKTSYMYIKKKKKKRLDDKLSDTVYWLVNPFTS